MRVQLSRSDPPGMDSKVKEMDGLLEKATPFVKDGALEHYKTG